MFWRARSPVPRSRREARDVFWRVFSQLHAAPGDAERVLDGCRPRVPHGARKMLFRAYSPVSRVRREVRSVFWSARVQDPNAHNVLRNVDRGEDV